LLGVGILVTLGLIACLLTTLPRTQRVAPPNPTLNATNAPNVFVPLSEYNKLVQAETQLALVVSNLQAAASQQSQDLTNLYAKMTELDSRANGQETGTKTLTESCGLLQTNMSQTLGRIEALQRAVIKLSLGVQELDSRSKPAPPSSPN